MRIGVMGGTFDPVHIAHLIFAEQAWEQLALDKVLFIPAGDPWRKAGRDIAPAHHRLAMVKLAIADNERFEVDDRELRREGPTYTVETLRELREALNPDDELFLLLGEDAIADLPNWHDPSALTDYATLATAPRESVTMPETLPVDPAEIEQIDMPYLDVSSTDLRRRVRLGRSIGYFVPPAVEAYIAQHGLYLE